MGYESDERDYEAASQILRELGIDRVRLLTNKPAKIRAHAIAHRVAERIPIIVDSNPHNACYLRSKVERAGHFS